MCDMALLAVGLDMGHALHHRDRGRVCNRFLFPRPHHADPSASVNHGLGKIGRRGDGSVAVPPEMVGSHPAGPRGGLITILSLSGLVVTAAVYAPLAATVTSPPRRARITDVSEDRSLYRTPIPRGSGLAIVLTASLVTWIAVFVAMCL